MFYNSALRELMGFPGGSVVTNPSANAGDARNVDTVPGLGRPSGARNDTTPVFLPGQSMDRGAWQTVVHGVTRVGSILATKPPYMEKIRQWAVYSCFIPVHFWLKLKALTDSFPDEKRCSFSCKMIISGNTMPRADHKSALKWTRKIPKRKKPSW